MLDRRKFIKTTLAVFTAAQFAGVSAIAGQLNTYLAEFEKNRSPKPDRQPTNATQIVCNEVVQARFRHVKGLNNANTLETLTQMALKADQKTKQVVWH